MNRFLKRDQFLHALECSPQVMGVLNVTPDSFSDGGQFTTPDKAIAQAQKMADQGAAIIDIGAESSRPGHTKISAREELSRLEGILKPVCEALPTAISIDTYKASVAHQCAAQGVALINDIWGLQGDPDMAKVVAENQCAVVVMHNRHAVDDNIDIIADIQQFFARSLHIAQQTGISKQHIILDPGIGFGKTIEQNYHILNHLHTLSTLGYPLLLGLSRKRMIAHALGTPKADRAAATLAANVLGLQRGANILRVHDVAAHVDAIKIFDTAREIA